MVTEKGIHPGMLRISQLESGLLNSPAVSGLQMHNLHLFD